MDTSSPYQAPKSKLDTEESMSSKRYGIWKRFYITFLWGVPIFMIFVILGTPKQSWLMGLIGSAVISVGSGVLAILIPVQSKRIFVSVGVVAGLVFAGVSGAYFPG